MQYECGYFGGPTVESERKSIQGEARYHGYVDKGRCGWYCPGMLGHDVGQLCDAGDETRVQLVAVVVV